MDKKEYIKKRLDSQKKYFSKSSKENKNKYIFFSITKLSISLSITILSLIFGEHSISSIIISILAAIITFLDGILLLKKYQENWINYRVTNEQLKKEESYYYTDSEKYFGLSEESKFNLFVQCIENIIQNSNQVWKNNNSKHIEK